MRDRDAFLTSIGIDPSSATKIAGDASFRSYYRVPQGILMDAPPEEGEDCAPFVAIANWLIEHGFSAPRILEADLEQGFLLLEDLGDDLFKPLLTSQNSETLYGAALEVLVALSQIPAPDFIPPYDFEALDREVALFTDWYWPMVMGEEMAADQRAEYLALWPHVLPPKNPVAVLRDYHAENLIWLPKRAGVCRVGLLDFQDALAGHPAYDVISLSEDARRDVSPEERAFMFEHYAALQGSGFDRDAFEQDAAILAAQRSAKIIGIFARLALRDKKPIYLGLIGRVWGSLTRKLQHPALADLNAWFAKHCPPEMRRNPPHAD